MPEEIFDFLFDNPIFLILLLYWVVSSVLGKKKKQKQQEEKKSATQATKQTLKAERKERFREALDKLGEAVDAADRMFDGSPNVAPPPVKPAKISPPRPSAAARSVAAEKKDDPYAFHSMRGAAERMALSSAETSNYDVTAKDYDITAQDYDLTAEDYDLTATDYDQRVEESPSPKDAFAFHSLSQQGRQGYQPVGGFHEFHSAHGLSKQERTGVTAIKAVEVEVGAEHGELPFSVTNPEEFRRAFILQEVLGRPKAFRR